MIIDNKNKLIFIHIPKNAGSSVENFFFSELKTKRTIIIKLTDFLKKFSKIGIYAWLYVPILFICFKIIFKTYHKDLKDLDFEKFNNYKVFTVLRHPQDRIVSYYYYYGFNKKLSFYEFLDEISNKNDFFSKHIKRNQFEFIKCNNKCDINILNYDNLENDFKAFCEKNNLDLKKLKKINKSDDHNKSLLYSGKDRNKILKLVYTIYKDDFDTFNYKFKY